MSRYLGAASVKGACSKPGGPRERMRLTTADRFGFNDVGAPGLIAVKVGASLIIPLFRAAG
jgi:hypothetical protein